MGKEVVGPVALCFKWMQGALPGTVSCIRPEFVCKLPEFVLQDLPCCVHGKFLDEVDVLGALVPGDSVLAVVDDILLGDVGTRFPDDEGTDLLSVLLALDTDDLDIPDAGAVVQVVLDLLGLDVLPSADDHVLDPSGDVEVSIGIPVT